MSTKSVSLTSCNSSNSNPFCIFTNMLPLFCCFLIHTPIVTKCNGAIGLTDVSCPEVLDKYTDEPSLRASVLIPLNNPNVII